MIIKIFIKNIFVARAGTQLKNIFNIKTSHGRARTAERKINISFNVVFVYSGEIDVLVALVGVPGHVVPFYQALDPSLDGVRVGPEPAA